MSRSVSETSPFSSVKIWRANVSRASHRHHWRPSRMARKTAVVKFRGTGGSGPPRRVRPRSPRSSLLWLREDAEHVAPQHAALPVRGPAAGGTARQTGWLAHLGEVASNALFVGDQRAQFH